MCHSSKDTKTNDINEGRISFFSHMVYVHEINMLISPSTLMFSLLNILTLPELRLSWKEIWYITVQVEDDVGLWEIHEQFSEMLETKQSNSNPQIWQKWNCLIYIIAHVYNECILKQI